METLGKIGSKTIQVILLYMAVSSMLPILIFVIFAGMISNGNLGAMLSFWKSISVILLSIVGYYVLNLLRISLTKKILPALLLKKAGPTLLIALTTTSSAAAFSTNIRDANCKFGIDKKLVEFDIPLEVMGVAIAIDAIIDFPLTACNVSSWQLTMIDVADSLNMSDRTVLYKEESNMKIVSKMK